MPDIFAEFLLAALRFAALWVIFYLLHHPRTLLRRILALFIMALQFPLCRLLYFSSGKNIIVSVICDTVLFIALAFICEGEKNTTFFFLAVFLENRRRRAFCLIRSGTRGIICGMALP